MLTFVQVQVEDPTHRGRRQLVEAKRKSRCIMRGPAIAFTLRSSATAEDRLAMAENWAKGGVLQRSHPYHPGYSHNGITV